MAQAFPKTLVIDIGKSYTKAFLVGNDKNVLVIEKKESLPTSLGDISFSLNKVISLLKSKDTPLIITGDLPESETLAKNLDAQYVSESSSREHFIKYLDGRGYKKPVILDTGNYPYSHNIKVNQIGAFINEEVSETDIENYFGNKNLKPQSIPVTKRELEIEEAFFRIAFSSNREFITSKNVTNLVVTGGFFSLSPKQSKLALIILDILYRNRVAQVKLDKMIFAHSFGALITIHPEIAEWDNDFLVDLGAFVSFGGRGKAHLDYGFSEDQEIAINEDEIALVPAPKDQQIKISFSDKGEKFKAILNGGLFGILLDGRVKPLRLAFGRAESRASLKRWQEAIEKVEIIE